MKKVLIILMVVVFLMTTSCSPKIKKDDSSVNEAYLLKMTEHWKWEIMEEDNVAAVKVAQSFFGPYSEAKRRECYREKEALEIRRTANSRKRYVVRISQSLPGNNFLIQILEILKE